MISQAVSRFSKLAGEKLKRSAAASKDYAGMIRDYAENRTEPKLESLESAAAAAGIRGDALEAFSRDCDAVAKAAGLLAEFESYAGLIAAIENRFSGGIDAEIARREKELESLRDEADGRRQYSFSRGFARSAYAKARAEIPHLASLLREVP